MLTGFKKWLLPHQHNWKLVACNDKYTTTYTDANYTKTWSMRFYECECGSRKVDEKSNGCHAGVTAAVKNWIDIARVPSSSFHPDQDGSGYTKVSKVKDEDIDPLNQLNATVEQLCKMMQVIKRDVELEKKYPALKKAADNYEKLLDKYSTFENLKDGK